MNEISKKRVSLTALACFAVAALITLSPRPAAAGYKMTLSVPYVFNNLHKDIVKARIGCTLYKLNIQAVGGATLLITLDGSPGGVKSKSGTAPIVFDLTNKQKNAAKRYECSVTFRKETGQDFSMVKDAPPGKNYKKAVGELVDKVKGYLKGAFDP